MMQFVCAPIVGKLSDRYGRRPWLIASMLTLAADSVFQALATSVTMLMAGRAIAGAAGASVATANALIADASTEQDRVKNFGLVGAVYGLGLVMGPAVGGVVGLSHVRAPFVAVGILACLAAGWAGMWRAPTSIATEHSQRVTSRPEARRAVWQRPFIIYFAAAVLCSSLAQRGLENLFVLYTKLRFEWTSVQAGVALCLLGLMAIVVQGSLARPVVSRYGERAVVLFSLCVMSVTYIGLYVVSVGWLVYPLLAHGSLSGLAGPALQSFITARVDSREQGRVQGLFVSMVSLSSMIAPLLFTSVVLHAAIGRGAATSDLGEPFLDLL